MEPQFIQIPEFNPRVVRQDAACLIVGRRATGKTTIAKSLCFNKPGTNIVMSPSEDVATEYALFVKPELVYTDYSEDVIEEAIAFQTRRRTNYINIILDDCLQNTNHRSLRAILCNGRHLRISTTICMSHPSLPPALRANIDYVFMLRETDVHNRRKLYEQYGHMFQSFDDFCSVFDSCTNKYECLVIDIHLGRVFWYKTNTIRFKIAQILKNPEFASFLRVVGRTRLLKHELAISAALKQN